MRSFLALGVLNFDVQQPVDARVLEPGHGLQAVVRFQDRSVVYLFCGRAKYITMKITIRKKETWNSSKICIAEEAAKSMNDRC